MIWVVFGYNTPAIWTFHQRQTETIIPRIIRICIEVYDDNIDGPNFIFQYDNAPIHCAEAIQTFQRVNVEILCWPSRHSDMNLVRRQTNITLNNLKIE